MEKKIDDLIAQIDVVVPKYVGIIDKERIIEIIKSYVKNDKFNILRPTKSDKYIKYWAAITYYDPKLSEAISVSPAKWYHMICAEIKEYVQQKSLSNAEIARYYRENY